MTTLYAAAKHWKNTPGWVSIIVILVTAFGVFYGSIRAQVQYVMEIEAKKADRVEDEKQKQMSFIFDMAKGNAMQVGTLIETQSAQARDIATLRKDLQDATDGLSKCHSSLQQCENKKFKKD